MSTVPNTGRNLSNSNYRGLDEEDCLGTLVDCDHAHVHLHVNVHVHVHVEVHVHVHVCRGEWGEMGLHREAPREMNAIENLKDAPIFNCVYPYNVTLFIIYVTLFCSIIIRARLRYSKKRSVKIGRNGPYAGETDHSLGRNRPLWGELGHLFNIQFREFRTVNVCCLLVALPTEVDPDTRADM